MWIEKMEGVFEISYCFEGIKVQFAAFTLIDATRTWWNDHVKTMGVVAANPMSWNDIKALLVEEYCPGNEGKNLEHNLWKLKMKGSNIKAYIARFNDLALLCLGMVSLEHKKVESYL